MTTQNQSSGRARSLWAEIAGGAHALAQIMYIILLLTGCVVGAIVRSEVINAHNEDRFAAIDTRHAERAAARAVERAELAADRAEERRQMAQIRDDVAAIRLSVVRLEGKVDNLRRPR